MVSFTYLLIEICTGILNLKEMSPVDFDDRYDVDSNDTVIQTDRCGKHNFIFCKPNIS